MNVFKKIFGTSSQREVKAILPLVNKIEQNFATLLEMLNTMQVLEDDEEYQNPVDLLFEELAKKKPNSFAGRQYKLYKLAAGDICSK